MTAPHFEGYPFEPSRHNVRELTDVALRLTVANPEVASDSIWADRIHDKDIELQALQASLAKIGILKAEKGSI